MMDTNSFMFFTESNKLILKRTRIAFRLHLGYEMVRDGWLQNYFPAVGMNIWEGLENNTKPLTKFLTMLQGSDIN